jgi:hypothetical protein
MFHVVFDVRNATSICVSSKSFVILLGALPLYLKMAYLVFSCCESSVFVVFVLVGMSRA